MQLERDELAVDSPYRRDFLTYDNHLLDGDIFLQVNNEKNNLIFILVTPSCGCP